jgi:hypothetical protein
MASRRVSLAISWLLASTLVGVAGCYPSDSGKDIPLDQIYFPVGIAVSPGKSWMYVANSDFDLQYNGGSLQVYDLSDLRARIPKYCRADEECAGEEGGRTSCDTTGEDIDVGGGVVRTVPPTHRCVGPSANPCESLGDDAHMQPVAEQFLSPGLCTPVKTSKLLYGGVKNGAVRIGPFATDVIYATNPLKDGKGGRLFIPVRGDASLHWIDVDDDTVYPDGTDHRTDTALECGQGGGQICDADHRRGREPEEVDAPVLPAEPYGVAVQGRPYGGVPDLQGSQFARDEYGMLVTDTVEAVVTTHQSGQTAQVALFVNNWGMSASDDGPHLEFNGSGLPSGALSVASVPLPAIWLENQASPGNPTGISYLPSFLTTFRNAPQVSLVRTFGDAGAEPANPFIDASRISPIRTNSTGFDSRGIAVDSSARTDCEAPETGQCVNDEMGSALTPDQRRECLLEKCVPIPLDAYVANRTPASLVIGHTPPPPQRTLSDDLPRFTDMIPMSLGPSRVFVGKIIDTQGQPATRVFVVCFDSRRIFVFDPKARRFDTTIVTGRGPHGFAVDFGTDEEGKFYAYGYVGMFSDSYLGVVDLNQQHVGTYGTIVLSVGERTPPRASK